MPARGPRDRAVTRRDVAERAGVSTAAVSYVVTGARRVGPQTEARIRAAIEELGYRPNGNARALRTGRSEMLALIVPDVSNPLFADLAMEIEAAAAQRGYALVIANSHDDPTAETALIEGLRARSVDGLLVASVQAPGTRSAARRPGAPIVWVDAFEPGPGMATVGPDGAAGAHALVTHLIAAHGRSAIALVTGRDDRSAHDARRAGWAAALAEAGLPVGPVEETAWTRDGGLAAGHRLLTADPRPDAVFAASDLIAVGVLRAAADLGVRIPQDVAVACFDGTAEAAFSTPRLTAWRQPVRPMSAIAVDAVLDHPERIGHIAVPGELILRESCGCPPAESIHPA